MTKVFQFKYQDRESFYHDLSGTSKLIFSILISLSALLTELWYLVLVFYGMTIALYLISKIKYSDCYRLQTWSLLMTVFIFLSVVTNHINVFQLNFTSDQLIYSIEVFLKFRIISHFSILFVLTTHPGRFSANLNQLGVPYRIAYTLSQPLRGLMNFEDYYYHAQYLLKKQDYPLVGRRSYLLQIRDYFKVIFIALYYQNQGKELLDVVKDMNHFGAQTEAMWIYNQRMSIWDLVFLLIGAMVLSFSILFTI